jgi:hypothetical protein
MAVTHFEHLNDSANKRRVDFDITGEIGRPIPPQPTELTDWLDEMSDLLGSDSFRID